MFALLKGRPEVSTGAPEEIPQSHAQARNERAILCATCVATITSPRHRLVVHGFHQHRFMNPAGLPFHIGCFAEAIGCTVVGPDSNEYPWFPGLAWRFALCAACGQHLGWHFRGKGSVAFFGLILDRLTQPREDG
jgi:hypothetical protein